VKFTSPVKKGLPILSWENKVDVKQKNKVKSSNFFIISFWVATIETKIIPILKN
jgi:hypothetical protein